MPCLICLVSIRHLGLRRSDHTDHPDRKRKRDGQGHAYSKPATKAGSSPRAPRRQPKCQRSSNTTGQDSTSTCQQGEGRQVKRSTTTQAHHLDEPNAPNSKDGPTVPKSKGGRWTEQDLHHIINKATQSPFPGALA